MDGLTEGRMVHFVMPDGEHRPAVVVRVWNKDSGYVNLQVFTDGTNDSGASLADTNRNASGIRWETSVPFDVTGLRQPRTWHWIEHA